MTSPSPVAAPLDNAEFFSRHWEERLSFVVRLMRDISKQTEPLKMTNMYAERMKTIIGFDRSISLSRRDLVQPHVRITRSSTWDHEVNPWENSRDLPLMRGGLLADLIYAEGPTVIDELNVSPDDPAADYFAGMRSCFAIPLFDHGKSLNMVMTMSAQPNFYDRERVPEFVWLSNLFGRATQTLVLSAEVQKAYDTVDRELQSVAEIQRSLLPSELPTIPGLDLAAYYLTSARAGGDYYDFFPLPDGRWGILIADVSGHGTPAAVLMAVMHSIAHAYAEAPSNPGAFLTFINRKLATRYTNGNGTFVTGLYGVYDPKTRQLIYASAGHPPPRLRLAGQAPRDLPNSRNLPLGIERDEQFETLTTCLTSGETLVFYTDGITETRNSQTELFGTQRLDDVLASATGDAKAIVEKVLAAVDAFGEFLPATDDRTLLVAKVE